MKFVLFRLKRASRLPICKAKDAIPPKIGRNLQMSFLHARLPHEKDPLQTQHSPTILSIFPPSCDSHLLQHRRLKSPFSRVQQVSLIGPFFPPLHCNDLLLAFQLEQNDTARSVLERNGAGRGGRDTFPTPDSKFTPFH